MFDDPQILLFTVAIFGIVFVVVLATSLYFFRSTRIGSRLASQPISALARAGDHITFRPTSGTSQQLGQKFFGLDQSGLSNLRRDLISAGFFGQRALRNFLVLRLVLAFGLPVLTWFLLLVFAGAATPLVTVASIGLSLFLGYAGPMAYLSRRVSSMRRSYRDDFPDLLDMLLVCVDSGLSLEASVERVGREIEFKNKALATNVQFVSMEMRAGKGVIDALQSLAARLGIDEAQSLATLLRQSSELGTSISQSLRVYSNEMRDKRMARAEERAYALPAKLVLPLGAFIFPVMLIAVMYPLIIRIMQAVR